MPKNPQEKRIKIPRKVHDLKYDIGIEFSGLEEFTKKVYEMGYKNGYKNGKRVK
jgi:hypothetical protein